MFVDIDPVTFNIDPQKLESLLESMTNEELSRVKAVIPVHLFGHMADMQSIVPVCRRFGLKIIEDAAQAIGSECPFNGAVRRAGSVGDIGCFSFFPSKNLGGFGDGGMVVTNDADLCEKMKILRVHGSNPKYYHRIIGGNFRLDEIQAAVLLVKLKYLDRWTESRQKNAGMYNQMLADVSAESFRTGPLPGSYIINTAYERKARQVESYSKKTALPQKYTTRFNASAECFGYLRYKQGDPVAEEAALTARLPYILS